MPEPTGASERVKEREEPLSLHFAKRLMARCVWEPQGENDTGWRRPIVFLKVQVIFCKRATNCWALWRRITYTDKASSGSSPPCREEEREMLFGFHSQTCMAARCGRERRGENAKENRGGIPSGSCIYVWITGTDKGTDTDTDVQCFSHTHIH